MTLEIDRLRYVGLDEEPTGDANYGKIRTIPGTFLALPYMEGSLKIDPDTTNLDPMAGKVGIDDYDVQIPGPKKVTAAFDIPLHSHGLDLNGVNAAPTISTWAFLRLLKICLGGVVATTNPGAPTLVVAGTTINTVTVTTGHGARFQRGSVIACQTVSGSTALEAKEVASVAGDVVTVKEAFSAIPTTGTQVRGGVTAYPTRDPDTSAQLLIEGRELSDRFAIMGLNGGFGITAQFGQDAQPSKFSFNLGGADWSRLADGSGVTTPTYSPFQLIRSVDAPLTVPVFGTSTRALVHQADFKLELALQYMDERSGSGVNGIRRKRRLPGRPLVKGSFVERFEDQTRWASYEAREIRSVYQQLGTIAGGICLISVPRVQFGQPKRAAAGEAAGTEVPFWSFPDTTGGTTELETAAIRFHFV
ncbi:hypothetical protein [Sandaracinus amylolyticus]|uniref:hypothetical protein n=1 Tax=Sandaracinus amylolyticus TaxID=927083 RepID=UPI001F2675F9|nr:hypothetical protein [Sandaracinus amylolyticus]UJR81489.1 Hypothetical protein I5071_35490 [Sandaracinus amylolyticus]